MKAPNLPDKIYFSILDVGSGYVYTPSFENNGGAEYIRKDALLEWLKSELENGGPTTLVQHIINRINTL